MSNEGKSLSGSQHLAWARTQQHRNSSKAAEGSCLLSQGGKHRDGSQRFQQVDTIDSAAIKLEVGGIPLSG